MTKMKVLGLGVLAAMALSVVGVMNAGAVTGGHFTSDSPSGLTTIVGTETPGTPHVLHLVREGAGEGDQIGCDVETYHGTMTGSTAQSLTITPTWEKCYTTGDTNKTNIPIHVNGCDFAFTSGALGQAHHTAHLLCPGPKQYIEITHPNCTIRVPAQTTQGVTYDTIMLNNKHAITLNVTTKGITSHYEAGICIFLGTSQKSEMKGGVTVEGFDDVTGLPVNITSTTG